MRSGIWYVPVLWVEEHVVVGHEHVEEDDKKGSESCAHQPQYPVHRPHLQGGGEGDRGQSVTSSLSLLEARAFGYEL